MMERWEKLSIFTKGVIITTILFLIINFNIGFRFAVHVEQNRLKNICSSVLEIEKSDIQSVRVTKKEVYIKLVSFNKGTVSTEDRSIYKDFNPKHILQLKDGFYQKEITIK